MTLSKEFVWSRVLQYRNFATFLVLDHVSPQTSPFSSLQVECTQPEGYRKGRSLSQLLNNLIKGCWKNSANVATEILKDSWRGNLSVWRKQEGQDFKKQKERISQKMVEKVILPTRFGIFEFSRTFSLPLLNDKRCGKIQIEIHQSLKKSAGKFSPP